jgi:hypothetical protein
MRKLHAGLNLMIPCRTMESFAKDTWRLWTALAAEIAFMNDFEWDFDETPAARWGRMRHWVQEQIKEQP